MFLPGHWALAFINSLEFYNADIESGICALETLSSWTSSLPGAVFGSSAAKKLEALIREGMAKTLTEQETESPALEPALRFLLLTVRKNTFRYIEQVTKESRKLLDKKRGIVTASVEYVFEPEEEFKSLIIDSIKKRTGTTKVRLEGQLNPALIGGFRLRIGDEIIDASIRSQLRKLESCLTFDGGY